MSAAQICVVGGGPAGLAAAIGLRREGCEVTAIDCAVPPIDKSCGEGLMPDSIGALRELGIELPPDFGHGFDGICFRDGRVCVRAEFAAGGGRGVRRTALHDLLAGHAAKAGVLLAWGAKHVKLHAEGVLADGELRKADWVIGADGQNSGIRAQAGLAGVTQERRRYGFRRHYRIAPWSSCVELHWGPDCQIYITPVSAGEVCVALISREGRLRLDRALAGFPELQERLRRAERATSELGAMTVSRKLRRVCRAGGGRRGVEVALAGDASGSVDAITGQGMCAGFEQALALAACFRRGNLSEYDARHAKLMRRPRIMGSLLLALSSHEALRRRTLAGLARRPELFEALVAIHTGESGFRDLRPRKLLALGAAFLSA